MAIFGPIHTERKFRKFGVLDLEWVPGEELPLPVNTDLQIEGIRMPFKISLPVLQRRTQSLKLRLAGYYDQQSDEVGGMVERFHSFTTMSDLVDFILSRDHRSMWFYAHAGGLYDMEFVLDELLKQIKDDMDEVSIRSHAVYDRSGQKTEEIITSSSWIIRAAFSGSSAIIIHVTKGKNTWHFVDSYWLLRDKLSKIGESIGIKKIDEDKRRTQQEAREYFANTPLSVLIPYNRADCEILWKAIAAFEKEIVELGGQLQQTIASTAMGLFRRSYLKQEIYTSESINILANKSYFASRVEVLARNVDDFFIYDINSSFPYSMTFPLPGNLKGVGTSLPDDESDECLYMADVTVEVPDMYMPPLPFRTIDNGRVFFPTGRWRSWFTSTDIVLAIKEGCKIHKVHEVYFFEPFLDFAQYAKEIYALRSSSTTSFRKLVLKYLLNSLYGKAAESPIKQEMLINPDFNNLDRSTLQMLQPGIWLREKTSIISHRHVIISSVITALSRRLLYNYAKICFDQQKPLYYCDTDSLATKADLPIDDKQLGMLKLEKKMEWADFVAPKIYRGEGLEIKNGQWKSNKLAKAKGFSLGDDSFNLLKKIMDGEQVGVQGMIRMRELYRTQKEEGKEYKTAPYEKLVIKALTFETVPKRFPYPDGNTRPWNVREIVSGDIMKHLYDFDGNLVSSLDEKVIEAITNAV